MSRVVVHLYERGYQSARWNTLHAGSIHGDYIGCFEVRMQGWREGRRNRSMEGTLKNVEDVKASQDKAIHGLYLTVKMRVIE